MAFYDSLSLIPSHSHFDPSELCFQTLVSLNCLLLRTPSRRNPIFHTKTCAVCPLYLTDSKTKLRFASSISLGNHEAFVVILVTNSCLFTAEHCRIYCIDHAPQTDTLKRVLSDMTVRWYKVLTQLMPPASMIQDQMAAWPSCAILYADSAMRTSQCSFITSLSILADAAFWVPISTLHW